MSALFNRRHNEPLCLQSSPFSKCCHFPSDCFHKRELLLLHLQSGVCFKHWLQSATRKPSNNILQLPMQPHTWAVRGWLRMWMCFPLGVAVSERLLEDVCQLGSVWVAGDPLPECESAHTGDLLTNTVWLLWSRDALIWGQANLLSRCQKNVLMYTNYSNSLLAHDCLGIFLFLFLKLQNVFPHFPVKL